MKYFTKFLCLFLGAAMMLTMAACGSKSDTDANAGADGEKKQLVVATSPDFPPFEFLDGSQIVGIEPALMQAIADKLGMELVWEQVDFDSIIPGIQAERYDVGAAGITITPDRQKNCDFSNPYFLANQVIVVNPGSDIQGKADLAGKTIAVQTGTTAEEYCMDNGYSVLSFASNNDAQAALTSGKADAWVVDNEAAARMAADQSLTVLDEAMTSEPYAFAFCQGQQPGGPGEHRPSGAASGRHRGEAFPGVRHRVRVSPELMSIFQQIGQFFARWLAQLEATFIEKQRYLLLVDGLKNTLVITLCALVIGVTIGALVAMIKYCGQGSRLLRPLCWLCDVYTTVIRGIPVVVQLLIFYFLILKSSDGWWWHCHLWHQLRRICGGADAQRHCRRGSGTDGGRTQPGCPAASRLAHCAAPGHEEHSSGHRQRDDRPAEGDRRGGLCGGPGPDPGREPDPQQHLRRLQSPAAGGGGVSAAGHRHDAAAGAAGKEAAQK